MRRSLQAASLAAGLVLAAVVTPAAAQNGRPSADAAQPPKELWSVRCTAIARDSAPDCAVEQRAVVTETGRLLMQFTVRVPAQGRKPVMMVQAPLGPYLPAGITLDIDGATPLKLDYQTCDAKGCYAGAPLSDDLLQAMFRGQKLNITIQTLNKQPVQIPMDLTGFTAAYKRIQ